MSEQTAKFVAIVLFGSAIAVIAVCGIIHLVRTFAPFALTISIG